MTTAPLPRIRGRVRRVRFDRCQSPVLTSPGTQAFAAATSSGSVVSSSAAVIAGTLLGLLLDHVAGTEPVFTMAGVFLGIVAGRPRLLGPRPRSPQVGREGSTHD